MAVSLKGKTEAALALLLGMRHARVRRALVPHGFGDDTVSQGFALLQAIATPPFPLPSAAPKNDMAERRDDFLATWLPVARGVLGHYPKVSRYVLVNLSIRRGHQAFLLMGVLLERLDRLQNGHLGEQGRAALEALEERGLNAKRRAEGQALVAALAQVRPEPEPDLREHDHATTDALWT